MGQSTPAVQAATAEKVGSAEGSSAGVAVGDQFASADWTALGSGVLCLTGPVPVLLVIRRFHANQLDPPSRSSTPIIARIGPQAAPAAGAAARDVLRPA